MAIRNERRELKTGTWYVVEGQKGKATAVESKGADGQSTVGEQNYLQAKALSYCCDITKAQEFGALIWAKGCQRRVHLAEEIVFVCDGAVWIWRLVEALFPCATQIVELVRVPQKVVASKLPLCGLNKPGPGGQYRARP